MTLKVSGPSRSHLGAGVSEGMPRLLIGPEKLAALLARSSDYVNVILMVAAAHRYVLDRRWRDLCEILERADRLGRGQTTTMTLADVPVFEGDRCPDCGRRLGRARLVGHWLWRHGDLSGRFPTVQAEPLKRSLPREQ